MNETPPTPEERREDLILCLIVIGVLIFLAVLGGATVYLSLNGN